MPRVIQRKPGPKSTKQSKIVGSRGTLGETSCSSSEDDSSPEQSSSHRTPRTAAALSKTGRSNVSEFRTPELEKDATDYGLEFTTSRIQTTSPRRCSTMQSGQEEQEEDNERPSTSKAKPKPRRKDPAPRAQSTKTAEKSRSPAAAAAAAATTQNQQNRRKPRNPVRLDKRFWREVEALQYREYLIPLLPFSRLVREIMQQASTQVTHITPTALGAIQTSSEMYLTQRLQDAYLLTLHRGRVTLEVRDMQLVNFLLLHTNVP